MHACVLDRRGRPALRAKKQVQAALSRVTAEFQVAHHRSVSAHRAHADGAQLSATAERSHTICTATANKSQSVTRYTHRQLLTSPASYAACSFAAVAHPRSCLVPAHKTRSLVESQPCGLFWLPSIAHAAVLYATRSAGRMCRGERVANYKGRKAGLILRFSALGGRHGRRSANGKGSSGYVMRPALMPLSLVGALPSRTAAQSARAQVRPISTSLRRRWLGRRRANAQLAPN